MFCKKCGKEIADDAQFCQFCGQSLTEKIQISQSEPKSQFIALVLCVFLGMIGVHDFYLRRNGCAIAKFLITLLLGWLYVGLIITGIWCIIDFIMILCKAYPALMTKEEQEKMEKYGQLN